MVTGQIYTAAVYFQDPTKVQKLLCLKKVVILTEGTHQVITNSGIKTYRWMTEDFLIRGDDRV